MVLSNEQNSVQPSSPLPSNRGIGKQQYRYSPGSGNPSTLSQQPSSRAGRNSGAFYGMLRKTRRKTYTALRGGGRKHNNNVNLTGDRGEGGEMVEYSSSDSDAADLPSFSNGSNRATSRGVQAARSFTSKSPFTIPRGVSRSPFTMPHGVDGNVEPVRSFYYSPHNSWHDGDGQHNNNAGTFPQQQQQQQQQEQSKNKDNRPSGVVYEYIAPPPINLTARYQLSAKFPNLADLDTASTSTALCGIVKDAEPYLDEWADYHFGLGFHTIYLIDNSKEHELRNWQNKRRNAGYSVRVLPKPGSHRQMYGYHMCAAEHKQDHTYMAFFDVDEFLVLKKHETIDEMLQQHLPRGSLAVSWHVFGTGFTSVYAPLPVTKRFTYRDGVQKHDRHAQWNYVKSIVKLSDYGGYPQSPHSMKTNKKTAGSEKAWTDTNGKGNFDKIGAINYDRPVDVAVIHHYKYLSPKEFYWKSCVRKTVDDKFKDCNNAKPAKPYVGSVRDDSAWRTLKKNVPKYAMFDEFEDFM
mmetsp:Transcript_8950/g.19374  ORF Transcript_8950/g.19374 Transcript_8950/m.19374 type:complete len:519 (+) Transcript_8950:251-1807(+)